MQKFFLCSSNTYSKTYAWRKRRAQMTQKLSNICLNSFANVNEKRYTCHERINESINVDWGLYYITLYMRFYFQIKSFVKFIFREKLLMHSVRNSLVCVNMNVGWTEKFVPECYPSDIAHIRWKRSASLGKYERRKTKKNCLKSFLSRHCYTQP